MNVVSSKFIIFYAIGFQLSSKHSILPVRPHCANARQNRCQEDRNSFPLGELDQTTRTPLYCNSQPAVEWLFGKPIWFVVHLKRKLLAELMLVVATVIVVS